MKARSLISFIFLGVAGYSIVGCGEANWASDNKEIPITTEIVSSLSASAGQSIKLTDEQKKTVLSCLVGPVKKNFNDKDLSPDVWVYWGMTNGQKDTDKIYFVRYPTKGEYFSLVGVDPNGNLFESSGGRLVNGRLPAYFGVDIPNK